jgi:hypothetical protein
MGTHFVINFFHIIVDMQFVAFGVGGNSFVRDTTRRGIQRRRSSTILRIGCARTVCCLPTRGCRVHWRTRQERRILGRTKPTAARMIWVGIAATGRSARKSRRFGQRFQFTIRTTILINISFRVGRNKLTIVCKAFLFQS